MCGIFGVVGNCNALGAVLRGLAALEYRGYDSAGLAWQAGGQMHVARTAGRVADLAALLPPGATASCAIGHTRWATHGAPCERNAHPHCDASGRVAVVHNGIIENHMALRRELESQGIPFSSDTDTEVVAHLIGRAYRGDLAAAVAAILPLLDGSFALAIMAADAPDLIVAARRGSPLAVGVGDGCLVLASDAVPILHHTRRVVFLEDEQMATLVPQAARFFSSGREITPQCQVISWSAEAAQKGGYEHFMLKEIYEQPSVLENLIRRRVRMPEKPDLPPQIAIEEADIGLEFFRRVTRIVLIGQGTAYHACMIGRNMLERVTRLPAYAEYAADFRYRDPILDPSVLVIAVTQSGETADTLGGVRVARAAGCKVLAVVNAVGSSIAREADGVFYLHCGPEIGVASTKAFTAMIAGLYLLALRIGQMREAIGIEEQRRRIADVIGVGPRLQSILAGAERIKQVADKYQTATNFLFLGRGTGWPLAMEGALKLKEVSYIHAEGYDAAEMKHGPIALVDENMPVLFIALQGRRYEKIRSNIAEVKARQGRIIAIASHDDKEIGNVAEDVIRIRAESGIMNSICCALPLQLLAYYMAVARGCDVDKPKNLAKSVTVE